MNKDKKKLFEAFEKICKVKLIKESMYNVDDIEEYLLDKLVLNLELEEGRNDVDEYEFDFKVNNEDFYGKISMSVYVECDEHKESEYAPGYSDCVVSDISITNLEIDDIEFSDDFISKLEKNIEINIK
jgi:hypothetical protein